MAVVDAMTGALIWNNVNGGTSLTYLNARGFWQNGFSGIFLWPEGQRGMNEVATCKDRLRLFVRLRMSWRWNRYDLES